MVTWYIEGFADKSQNKVRAILSTHPFAVGRRSSCDLTLRSKMVSSNHAEIVHRDGGFWIRDLGSTNGTFVNGQKVGEEHQVLHEGDIIHFADLEFTLISAPEEQSESASSMLRTMKLDEGVALSGIARYRELREMLARGAVRTDFQPLVRLSDSGVLGFEVLGRGDFEMLPASPGELFAIAELIGLEVDLSLAFRNKGIDDARDFFPREKKIFVNTHPSELADQSRLLSSLESKIDHADLVLEIHESAIADVAALSQLCQQLDRLGIEVAFDDFGTGQARLLELTEASPHYVKFDRVFTRNLDLSSSKRRDMVQTLVTLTRDMGIVPIAEGIERPEEAAICLELGFEYGQGYHLGRPAPAAVFRELA